MTHAEPGTHAEHAIQHEPDTRSPAEFWEDRYTCAGAVWSGRVNRAVVDVLTELRPTPGRALDLGCGEGADAVWLAGQGWQVTAVDISPTAVARGAAAAAERGLAGAITWLAEDLTEWQPPTPFELVTASFFQAPVALDRTAILRRAAGSLVRGGHLLVVTHAAPPPGSSPEHHRAHLFTTAQQERDELDLGGGWTTVLAEVRLRPAIGHDGEPTTYEDGVLLLRRD